MRILSIFNRYRHYGGEETMMRRIDDVLSTFAFTRAFVYSTDELIGHSLPDKATAVFKSLHNGEVANQLVKLQEEHSFDAWLVHNIFPALSPAVFSTAFKLGVPVIFMAHNYRLGCINGFMLRNNAPCELCMQKNRMQGIKYKCWHDNYLLSAYNTLFQTLTIKTGLFDKASSFIALSNAQVPYLEKIGMPREKITVLPHFVDIPETYPPPKKDGAVLFMGRLSREKGVHLLLEAWKDLPPTDRKLIIAGTGPEEGQLKQYVADNHVNNVEFTGFVPEEEHADLWARTAIYAMPSTWAETAAMTILEGWAHGRPALAFDIGAASDYLKNDNFGWLADLNSPGSLREKLDQALSMPEERLLQMSSAVRNEAIEHHSAQVWLDGFTKLFHSIAPQ